MSRRLTPEVPPFNWYRKHISYWMAFALLLVDALCAGCINSDKPNRAVRVKISRFLKLFMRAIQPPKRVCLYVLDKAFQNLNWTYKKIRPKINAGITRKRIDAFPSNFC